MTRKMLRALVPAIGAAIVVIAPFVSVPVIMPGPAVVSAQGTGAPGILQFSGGPALGKRVLTRTATTTFANGSPFTWQPLTSVPLSWTVSTGTSDLFNVTFTAQCSYVEDPPGGLPPLFVGPLHRIRVRDTNTGLILNPYEPATLESPAPGGRTFCGKEVSTHTGTWARRFNAGPHNLVVEFVHEGITLSIDEWLFELVVYD